MTLRSWAWTKCCNGGTLRGAHIPTKTVGTYAPPAEITSTDSEIDEIVYELYGIIENERKIIEELRGREAP
jgi:hypothetical protein